MSKTIPLRRATYEELTEVITDLHTQNYLKEMEIVRLNNIINELKKRIEKAIKYIEDTSYKSYFSMLQADYNMSLDTLINILKGEDKE